MAGITARSLLPVLIIAGFSFGLLRSCAAESSEAEAPHLDWAEADCETPGAANQFVGKSQSELMAMLGPAENDRRFRLENGINEFTIELLNIYPMPENGWREILQQSWSADHCRLTVWSSHEDGVMRSVDTLAYADNVEF